MTLQPSDNPTGFKGVNRVNGASRPFKAGLRLGGHDNNLGCFATAEAAALAIARFASPAAVQAS